MLIAKIPQSQKAQIRVLLNDGRNLVDIRAFDLLTAAGVFTCTKIGITVAVSDIDAIIDALIEAKAASKIGGGNV